jgi:hypothetical protein
LREFAEGLSIELHNSRDVDDWLAWTVGGAPSDKTAMMDLLA